MERRACNNTLSKLVNLNVLVYAAVARTSDYQNFRYIHETPCLKVLLYSQVPRSSALNVSVSFHRPLVIS